MEFDYKNAGIYQCAARDYRANFSAVWLFSVMFFALEFVMSLVDLYSTTAIIYIAFGILISILLTNSFTYFLQQTALSGGADTFRSEKPVGSAFEKYLWRSTLMVLALTPLISPLAIYLVNADTLPDKTTAIITMVYSITIVMPLCSVFLALFGTILPAAVAGDDLSFRTAYQRSRGQFLQTLFQILSGPALAKLIIFMVTSAIELAGIQVEPYGLEGEFNLLGATISVLHNMAGFYANALLVVILCKAYLNATPQTDNP